jgi:hypothetical protein
MNSKLDSSSILNVCNKGAAFRTLMVYIVLHIVLLLVLNFILFFLLAGVYGAINIIPTIDFIIISLIVIPLIIKYIVLKINRRGMELYPKKLLSSVWISYILMVVIVVGLLSLLWVAGFATGDPLAGFVLTMFFYYTAIICAIALVQCLILFIHYKREILWLKEPKNNVNKLIKNNKSKGDAK